MIASPPHGSHCPMADRGPEGRTSGTDPTRRQGVPGTGLGHAEGLAVDRRALVESRPHARFKAGSRRVREPRVEASAVPSGSTRSA
jgi:hypothetical protein